MGCPEIVSKICEYCFLHRRLYLILLGVLIIDSLSLAIFLTFFNYNEISEYYNTNTKALLYNKFSWKDIINFCKYLSSLNIYAQFSSKHMITFFTFSTSQMKGEVGGLFVVVVKSFPSCCSLKLFLYLERFFLTNQRHVAEASIFDGEATSALNQ